MIAAAFSMSRFVILRRSIFVFFIVRLGCTGWGVTLAVIPLFFVFALAEFVFRVFLMDGVRNNKTTDPVKCC